jgi:DNA-binding GntR family transcriptional regulator
VPLLSERAYRVIKNAILSLELRPGEVLSIDNLADQFAISRTLVRDTLLLLEKDGLVTIVPHKGAKVSEISTQDVQEIFEVWIVLESYAAKAATSRLTTQDLQTLASVLQRSEQAFAGGEYVLSADLGRQLHDLLVQKVDNRRLTLYLDDLDAH